MLTYAANASGSCLGYRSGSRKSVLRFHRERGYGCLSSRTKNSPGKPGRFTELLQRAVWNEKCSSSNLMFHYDNGSSIRSYTLQAKMYALGVLSSYSRPRVSNDNPYSESLFRTLKYCPWWPERLSHNR
ncbi:transposase family protein [Salmonella enterica subsp. enterica serovar Enteritidis]|nr:transposase family protein [Salmonella enterica subsp. enterica serovar Enteritidis]MKU04559.1 transposase [Salmonella enterica subsp. enterica serovar Kinondoni]